MKIIKEVNMQIFTTVYHGKDNTIDRIVKMVNSESKTKVSRSSSVMYVLREWLKHKEEK